MKGLYEALLGMMFAAAARTRPEPPAEFLTIEYDTVPAVAEARYVYKSFSLGDDKGPITLLGMN